jgi:hypothetical protein
MNIVYKAYNFLIIGFFYFFPAFLVLYTPNRSLQRWYKPASWILPQVACESYFGLAQNMVTCGFGGGGERRSGDC